MDYTSTSNKLAKLLLLSAAGDSLTPVLCDDWLLGEHGGISNFCAENAMIADCLAERSGLETSVSREVFSKETGRKCRRYFASKSAMFLQSMSSLSDRSDFRVNLKNKPWWESLSSRRPVICQ